MYKNTDKWKVCYEGHCCPEVTGLTEKQKLKPLAAWEAACSTYTPDIGVHITFRKLITLRGLGL